jgi:hypothetical protein
MPFTRPFRCAVADGATQATFSARWAQLLVRHATPRSINVKNLERVADTARKAWRKNIDTSRLSYVALEKLQYGAFATFVGLELFPANGNTGTAQEWQSVAIGDSCLFQFRDGELLCSFPKTDPEAFNNNPVALATLPSRNAAVWEQGDSLFTSGTWKTGDVFLLATDALAQWLLREQIQGSAPLRQIEALLSFDAQFKHSFSAWVDALRETGLIRNDDTTLAWLRPEA